jgi:ubiquinone/menaquinone biosynthesis C-methylase UbiE
MTRSETAAPSVSRTRASWEDLGALDPLWAILSDSAHQYGRWNIDEFFATGEDEVRGVLAATSRLGLPRCKKKALDFGCGVGRLTRALAAEFDHAVGVDISQPMIDQAREYNRALGNCTFVLNDRADLSAFPSAEFDFVYSNIALQHVQDRSAIYAYIRDFIRVLRPDGIAVFQMSSHLRLRNRLQLRPRLYNALRALGVTPKFLYDRLRLHPITMTFVPERDVRRVVTEAGGSVLDVESRTVATTISAMYFVASTAPPSR